MTEQLISFETGELAKEKGFSIPYYYHGEDYFPKHDYPTQSSIQRWLREDHDQHILIEHNHYENTYSLKNEFSDQYGCWCSYGNEITFSSYEEALEAGLQKAIKLIL